MFVFFFLALTCALISSVVRAVSWADSTDLVKNNKDYWTPSQFDSEDNPLAHTTGTGPEIWEQAGGEVDAFIAGKSPSLSHAEIAWE